MHEACVDGALASAYQSAITQRIVIEFFNV